MADDLANGLAEGGGPAVSAEVRTAVLRGTLGAENPLSALRGNALVWSDVFRRADAMERRAWLERNLEVARVKGCLTYPRCPGFPEPRDLNVNMMPIKIRGLEATLPPELVGYMPMIRACLISHCFDYPGQTIEDHRNKVVYLTVHESHVPAGASQRRAGLHVERPGAPRDRMPAEVVRPPTMCPETGLPVNGHDENRYRMLAWGLGGYDDVRGIPVDGIYMVSNVGGTSRVWDALLNDPYEVTDAHGGFAPEDERVVRGLLGEGRTLRAGEVCWMTDRTPHESLPVSGDAYRQFFRLVVGRVSRWYSKHNTPNPRCPLPADVEVVDEDKFAL